MTDSLGIVTNLKEKFFFKKFLGEEKFATPVRVNI